MVPSQKLAFREDKMKYRRQSAGPGSQSVLNAIVTCWSTHCQALAKAHFADREVEGRGEYSHPTV